jgi:sugar phosphate isomerase/epimerase
MGTDGLGEQSEMSIKVSRRTFVTSSARTIGALAGVGLSAQSHGQSGVKERQVRLGLASYTFRNFTRAQLIGFMKQLKISDLNAKDVKDHLPTEPKAEETALADYAAAGIKLHAAGAIYFPKDDDSDIKSKFEYAKRAGIGVIVAGDPAPETLPRIERFVKDYDIKIAIHNHGPEDKVWPSPLDVLKAVRTMDSRIGCCLDVGHAARAGTDVVNAIHAIGPRLFNIHMKDLGNFSEKDSQVAVGNGKMPVKRIFGALIAVKYDGFVDLEYEIQPDDPMPGVISSFAYMRGILAGMTQDAELAIQQTMAAI